MIKSLTVTTKRQGLHEITHDIQSIIHSSGFQHGLCTLFIQHTSASLLIQENADPSARQDLEKGRFTSTVGPHEGHEVTLPDPQVDPGQDRLGTIGKVQILHLDNRLDHLHRLNQLPRSWSWGPISRP